MGIEINDFEFNGVQYSTQYYHPEMGLTLLARLGKLISPALLGIVTGAVNLQDEKKNNKNFEEEIASMVLPGLSNFLSEIDPPLIPSIMNEIFTDTIIKTGGEFLPLKVSHFQGRLGDMFVIAQKILAFQYANFLASIVGAIQKAPAMTTSTRPMKAL